MFSPDPGHPTSTNPSSPDYPIGHTHNDCGQWQGGLNVKLIGNNFRGYNDTTIGEALYSQSSPNPNGGGPLNPISGPGYYIDYPARQINGAGIQISGLNGGNCGGFLMDGNWWAGTNRVVTLSQAYPGPFGSIINNICERDHKAGACMNIPAVMLSGGSPALIMSNNLYPDGAPVVVFQT
jgi:hypothetical protein